MWVGDLCGKHFCRCMINHNVDGYLKIIDPTYYTDEILDFMHVGSQRTSGLIILVFDGVVSDGWLFVQRDDNVKRY